MQHEASISLAPLLGANVTFPLLMVSLLAAAAVGAVATNLLLVRRRPADSSAEDAAAMARLEAKLEVQNAELRRLADGAVVRDSGAESIRAAVEATRLTLRELQARDEERKAGESEYRDVVRRLSTVLAGTGVKGKAGENVVRQILSALPPSMLVTDLRVGGKVVEFALALPDGRRLPVDSKWTAVAELEALESSDDSEFDARARAVEKAVVTRAKEVAQYLDPAITAPVAVAAIPDAAYEVLKRAHADAYANGVVVVPYSSALPILLFLYTLVQRFGDASDVRSCLAEVAAVLDALDTVVENKFSRAATMLDNGTSEFKANLGRARSSIARAQNGELGADSLSLAKELEEPDSGPTLSAV